MRPIKVLLIALLPVLALGQTKLGPFTFLDGSRASNITLNFVLGGPGVLGVSAERAAPEALQFFDFIPGYAVRYFMTGGDGFYGEAAVISRSRYEPRRKIIGFIGLGPGLNVNNKLKITPTVSLVLGADFLLREKFLLSLAIRSAGMLTVGLGFHKGYGWR